MQTSSPQTRTWAEQVRASLLRSWQRLFLRGDFTALLLALGTLIVPALAMQAAGWAVGLGQLVPVAVLSVLFGFCWRAATMESCYRCSCPVHMGPVSSV